ncbi:hypothetical protein [Janibacter sp. GS2]|uniref:hypothetical protein n=1 Tax=Janibacter sp. GS2 TaxID=3442646 RepID=UPI003EBAF8FF
MRPARAIAVTTVTALAVAGCVGPLAGDDPSSPPSSSSASQGTTPSPTRSTDFGRAERELTDAEAKQVLPERPADATPNESATVKQRRTDPEVCIDLLRLGWQGRTAKTMRTAYAESDYFTDADDLETYQGYTLSVSSHSSPVSPGLLSRAGDALGQCEAFAFTGTSAGSSFDDRILAEGLPVRNIGEQTFAVRLTSFVTLKGRTHRIYLDHLDVRVGHNLVSVRSASYRESNGTEELEKKAQEILDNLAK